MNKRFEDIDEITTLASGAVGKEMYFRKSEALRVVTLCTENCIAILGIEIFELRNEGLQSKGFSDYEVSPNGWLKFVRANNGLADQFLKERQSAADVYVLTTTSKEEFNKLIGSA